MLVFWNFFKKVKIYVLISSHISIKPPSSKTTLQAATFFFFVVYLAHVVGNIIFHSAFIVVFWQFFVLGVTVLL